MCLNLFSNIAAEIGETAESCRKVTVDDNFTIMHTFETNEAVIAGGALVCQLYSHVLFEENATVDFMNNKAKDGGAICIQQSIMEFMMSSLIRLNSNSASRSGGAIHLSGASTAVFGTKFEVVFQNNNATRYGGGMYGELKQTNHSKILSTSNSASFNNNTALVGDDIYLHIEPSCDEICFNSSIVGLNVTHNHPSRHLVLYNPAICVDTNSTVKYCDTYFVNNIMLAQNIRIGACVLSLYDQPAGGVDFVVDGESQHHKLDGSNDTIFVPIACNLFEGIRVIGKEVSESTNFSISITLYSDTDIAISVRLIVELSPCHHGFHYDNSTQKCICYYKNEIVSCSGSTSTIKIGYWFGIVDGKRTVTVCPNNYCNFTCCETTNGFYELSPVRTDQCSPHRTGTACGSCEEGYTLSFDTANCVSIEKCTIGQTALVVVLSIVYWIALVIMVFLVTYYHIEISYFYVFTYYYSMLDILLGQNLYVSQGLFTAVSIMSSAAKVTPQFLGQFCLLKNMSGIDQQFIHYTHPIAITIIVAIICQSARMSHRFSSFISRGIIHVICLLLLLSYTSVATTSLLLLRSLTFDNVDKVYTYLSPDIEYFRGRHLPFGIVAILCTLVIVIGLPLLLLLEPFLNHKINFAKFKPLLDQFQGCYKDKYRSFAAYYMICRLVIITIIIISSTSNNTTHILLLLTTMLLALIQLIVKPYKCCNLNIIDGVVLQIMSFASVISLLNNFHIGVLLAVIILLVIIPLLVFGAVKMITDSERIKKIITIYCKPKPDAAKDSNEVPPINDIGIVIDDSMRKNATIIDM